MKWTLEVSLLWKRNFLTQALSVLRSMCIYLKSNSLKILCMGMNKCQNQVVIIMHLCIPPALYRTGGREYF